MRGIMKGKKFDAGKLDRTVIYRTYATTINAVTKSEREGVATDLELRANVIEANGSEIDNDGARTYKSVLHVIVRYRSSIKRGVKADLVYEGNVYDITDIREVPNTPRRTWMMIKAVDYE